MDVIASSASCGATVTGFDLREPWTDERVAFLESTWWKHKVLGFTDQHLSFNDLERLCLALGTFGVDPFIAPTAENPRIIEVKREPNESTPLFAEAWHSDWSFLPSPPAGTALYGVVIPPQGGDTLYADQVAAYNALSNEMKARIATLNGVHSAKRGYSRNGAYGEKDRGRSMDIRWSDDALATHTHPIVRPHPQTGQLSLFVSMSYTIGIEGMSPEAGNEILFELFAHQARDEFVYRHRWEPNMLTLWDNRVVLHAATGGYEGHRRLLHRITIAERPQ
jgi:taurine dioxygenase